MTPQNYNYQPRQKHTVNQTLTRDDVIVSSIQRPDGTQYDHYQWCTKDRRWTHHSRTLKIQHPKGSTRLIGCTALTFKIERDIEDRETVTLRYKEWLALLKIYWLRGDVFTWSTKNSVDGSADQHFQTNISPEVNLYGLEGW